MNLESSLQTTYGPPTGSYYHNTMGRMILRNDDPAADTAKAEQFWELLERLSTTRRG